MKEVFKMRIAIFANGIIADYDFVRQTIKECDFFIACDGGVRHTHAMQITPDCLIGDFDSAPAPILKIYETLHIPKIIFPVHKDGTDLALCMSYALEMKPSAILIFGAMGRRIDHTLANIHVLLQALHHGVYAELLDADTRIQMMDSHCTLYKNKFNTVSLIPFTEKVTGITTEGLLYPLCGETLSIGSTRGISNRLTGDKAVITLESGILLVVLSPDEGMIVRG